MQLRSTCKRIENIHTQIMTQDIPWKTLIKGKNSASKSNNLYVLFDKNTIAIQSWRPSKNHSHYQAIHFNKHESTRPMPCFQPSQMFPWLTYQALSHSTLSLFFLLLLTHNNYLCGCLYSSKSHKTTKWYYINHVLKPCAT